LPEALARDRHVGAVHVRSAVYRIRSVRHATPFMVWSFALSVMVACCSPTSPYECHNGRDGYGRGPVPSIASDCVPVGSDLQCHASWHESGYCASNAVRDITGVSEWKSSNPPVASFTSPGWLKVVAPGEVLISATYGFLSTAERAYAVAPGAAPEPMVHLLVTVEDATVPNRRLPDAMIDVMPTRGDAQECRSSSTGGCFFWVFRTAVQVRAIKPGYQPGEGYAAAPNEGMSLYVPLKLTPAL
jgi:hypothetical protein